MRSTVVVLVAFAVLLAAPGSGGDKRVITPPAVKPVGLYSPGLLVGGFLYVSGQGASGPDGRLPATFEDQVRQTLRNVEAVVKAAGLTMEHVVYLHVYLDKDNMANYDRLNRVWPEFFPKAPPARAVLGVYQLAGDSPVQINAVALQDLSRKKLIVPSGYPANLPWTPAVMAGERLYVSGCFGSDVRTGRIPDDPEAEVQLALDNMKEILAAAGLDFRHLVFVNPYLTEKVGGVMNKVYAKHFEFGNTPARATIRVHSLPGGNNIEFTGVATADLSKRKTVKPKNMPPSATASPCVWADDTLYCSAKSGFIPGPRSGIYASTVEGQLRQTMRNLLDGLEEADLDFSHVVATSVYLDDLNDFAPVNRVYGQYFSGALPTRTTVAQLPPGERKPVDEDRWPTLEQISLVAVK